MTKDRIADATRRRYGTALKIADLPGLEALAAPTKSDLQQATIMRLADPAKRAAVCALLPDSPWLAVRQIGL